MGYDYNIKYMTCIIWITINNTFYNLICAGETETSSLWISWDISFPQWFQCAMMSLNPIAIDT